jgi:hypothetical protein
MKNCFGNERVKDCLGLCGFRVKETLAPKRIKIYIRVTETLAPILPIAPDT